MNNSPNARCSSRSGMTIIEVLVATVLLVMGLATFLAAFSSIQRVSVTTDNRVAAMQRAREVLESVMALPYKSSALNVGYHSLSDASYTVSMASGYVTTKDIVVRVPWKSSEGNTPHNFILRGAMAQCIHE